MTVDTVTQEKCRDFVDKHVYYCQSSLVDHLLNSEVLSYDDIANEYEYLCPECGHTEDDLDKFEHDEEKHDESYYCTCCKKYFDAEPEYEPQEIFEWYIISDFLERKLFERNHPILRTDYGTWWGRCCTGQAILLDGYIEDIVKELQS